MKEIHLKSIGNLDKYLDKNSILIDYSFVNDKKFLFLIQKTSNENETICYEILNYENGRINKVFTLDNSSKKYYIIRNLGDEILLVNVRCRYFDADNIEKNADIYDGKGKLLDSKVFGDGISNIKIDTNNNIWISYFDEGIFGNYGWDYGKTEKPIGNKGLLCINKKWKIIYEYEPDREHRYTDDCLALTLDEENNPWFYYYGEFVICNLVGTKLNYFNPGIEGSGELSVSKKYFFLNSGWRDEYYFIVFDKNSGNEITKLKFFGEDGEQLSLGYSNFGKCLIIKNNKFYFYDLDNLEL